MRSITEQGPFWAETASTKGDQNWPFWIVRNRLGNVLGKVMSRADAERRAAEMNEAQGK
jgi:hypothetical protein